MDSSKVLEQAEKQTDVQKYPNIHTYCIPTVSTGTVHKTDTQTDKQTGQTEKNDKKTNKQKDSQYVSVVEKNQVKICKTPVSTKQINLPSHLLDEHGRLSKLHRFMLLPAHLILNTPYRVRFKKNEIVTSTLHLYLCSGKCPGLHS
jgi:hypothetical protein